MFLTYRACCAPEKNDEKSLQEPFAWTFSRRSCQNLRLGAPGLDFGRVWAPPGRPLDSSWAALGCSWATLGHSWAPLGRLLGTSWVLLGASWLPNAAQDGLGLDFSSILARFWLHFRRVKPGFYRQSLDLRSAFMAAGNPNWHSPGLFRSSHSEENPPHRGAGIPTPAKTAGRN